MTINKSIPERISRCCAILCIFCLSLITIFFQPTRIIEIHTSLISVQILHNIELSVCADSLEGLVGDCSLWSLHFLLLHHHRLLLLRKGRSGGLDWWLLSGLAWHRSANNYIYTLLDITFQGSKLHHKNSNNSDG